MKAALVCFAVAALLGCTVAQDADTFNLSSLTASIENLYSAFHPSGSPFGLPAPPPPESESPAPAPAYTDIDILNFALNLECIEAQFYVCATTGKPLPANLTGNDLLPIGCEQANFTNPDLVLIAAEIAMDEMNHVRFLRSVIPALNGTAVDCPQVDVGPAFAAAANAALNTTLNPPFSPYANDLFFLHGAFIFEDLGVTAYNGAGTLISSAVVRQAAESIGLVEAYHAGYIRTALFPFRDTNTSYGVTPTTILGAIANLENTAGGDPGVSQNIVTPMPAGGANITPTDGNSLAFIRSFASVSAIATLGGANSMGGFLPDGFNGNIK